MAIVTAAQAQLSQPLDQTRAIERSSEFDWAQSSSIRVRLG